MPVKRSLVRLLHWAFHRKKVSPESIRVSDIHSILIIRQHDMLGDFLLATPVLDALRAHFPTATIGVLVGDHCLDVILNHAHVNQILVSYKGRRQWNIGKLLPLLRMLRRQWDLTIVLNTVSHSLTSDLFALLSRAQYIVGSGFPPLLRTFSGSFYTIVAPYHHEPRHQTLRNLDIVHCIGVEPVTLAESIYLLDSEKDAAWMTLAQEGLTKDRPIIGIHIGAGKVGNRWPVRRFSQLTQEVYDRQEGHILLFWGSKEHDLAAEFCQDLSFVPTQVAPGSLRTLAATFSHCSILVSNDTGVMHVGAALGVPTVAVFGPTDPAEWKPIGDHVVGVRAESGAIEGVTVQQVHEAVTVLLNRTLHSPSGVHPDSRD